MRRVTGTGSVFFQSQKLSMKKNEFAAIEIKKENNNERILERAIQC
jgi:hypothetical protein